MNVILDVSNIKCHGCATTIRNTLDAIDGVNQTFVNVSNGSVIVDADSDIREALSKTLLRLGYPETNQPRINNTFPTKAKSLLSCILGRFKVFQTH